MACANPRTMYRYANGSCGFRRDCSGFEVVAEWAIGCGSCLLCRKSRAVDLSTRLQHEASLHEASCVPTLTYSDECLPALGSVSRRHVDLFLHQVRNVARREWGQRVRYDFISEYSPEAKRPHYHCVLFGVWPLDAEPFKRSRSGNLMFRSELLSKCWPYGHALFEDFSSGGAAYVANHEAFKLSGRALADELAVYDSSGSLLGHREAPFRLCSKHPGLGAGFFERYGEQMLRNQFTVAGSARVGVPRYYKRLAERLPRFEAWLAELREASESAAESRRPDETPERREVREQVLAAEQRAKRGRNGL